MNLKSQLILELKLTSWIPKEVENGYQESSPLYQIQEIIKFLPLKLKELIKIQHDLLYIGSELANDGEDSSAIGIDTINEDAVSLLENWIDRMTEELPPLKNFVIPGGHVSVSNAHLARCVCRRAERFITELNTLTETNPVIVYYINRLSDYLFTLARKFAFEYEIEEIKWTPRQKK